MFKSKMATIHSTAKWGSLFFAVSFFCACGKDSDSLSSAKKIDEINPEERAGNLREALDLRLSASSVGVPWEFSYSEAIVEEFLKADFAPLFQMNLKREDLTRLQCPGFNRATNIQKMKFYLTLLASIAEAESDFKNSSRSMAPNGTTNIGLFQMDVKAANAHTKNALGTITDHDLSYGEMNSRVGAHVLKNQLTKKGPVIFRGDYYWEVLNPNRGSIKNVVKYFHEHLDQLEFCP